MVMWGDEWGEWSGPNTVNASLLNRVLSRSKAGSEAFGRKSKIIEDDSRE